MFIKYQRYEWEVFKISDEQWEEARNYGRDEVVKGFIEGEGDDETIDKLCAEQWFYDQRYSLAEEARKLEQWDGETLDNEVYFGETEADL